METWTLNKGYPVVTIKIFEFTNLTLIKMSQNRFLFNFNTNDETTWQIPISLKTFQKELIDIYWLKEDESNLIFKK
jgi:hypothetical protein